MFFEIVCTCCIISSVLISILGCAKENAPDGKTVPGVTKLKDENLSIKEANAKKSSTDTNNNVLNVPKGTDTFKRPENEDKFAKRRDPNYMTLNGILDDCFDKTGDNLSDTPAKGGKDDKKEADKKEVDKKEVKSDANVKKDGPKELPQRPKKIGIAGSADPQYQTLNNIPDDLFEKAK
uniref:Lipoprotein n=1 Tax=Parastrongyloides trichosuri TaxID=131310 RepID=A0A0N5A2W7_PARTI